jgi:hypothetical protein
MAVFSDTGGSHRPSRQSSPRLAPIASARCKRDALDMIAAELASILAGYAWLAGRDLSEKHSFNSTCPTASLVMPRSPA